MAERFERPFLRQNEDGSETEITVEIEVEEWGSPGSYSEPAEGICCFVNRAWDTETDAPVTLTDAETAKAEADFCDDPPEADYPDYDDRD